MNIMSWFSKGAVAIGFNTKLSKPDPQFMVWVRCYIFLSALASPIASKFVLINISNKEG